LSTKYVNEANSVNCYHLCYQSKYMNNKIEMNNTVSTLK